MNTYTTHNVFFEINTEQMLNELYYRADSHILENDINSRLNNYSVQVKIVKCHIYINLFNGNQQIGHISLHIDKNNTKMSRKSQELGRFHAKNNTYNRAYTFKINKQPKHISYNITQKKINSQFKFVLDVVLDVLNEYYDPQSQKSLTKRSATYKHSCMNRTKSFMKTSRNKF